MAASVPAASYKYRFVCEPDDGLKCLICLEVAEEPWQHGECGRLFCKECLDEYGMTNPCANCRSEQPQYLKDGRSKREILALQVKCDNDKNCAWVGTVGTLQKHVDTCMFALIPCPKQCKGSRNQAIRFMRKNLDEHLQLCPNRDHTCQYCGEEGTYITITGVHDEVCPKKEISCPNVNCCKKIQRQHIQKHVDAECEHTDISCKYASIGCQTKLKRKDMPVHEEDDKLHLHMAIDTTLALKTEVATLQEKCVKLSTLNHPEPIKFKLTQYQRKKENNEVANFSSFYISLNGYFMHSRVYANGTGDGKGTHVSVYAVISEGKFDDELKWPFVGEIILTLLNQLEDSNHYKMTFLVTTANNLRAGNGWGYPKFIPHSELGHDPFKNTQYLKDDTLYFRMAVEPADHKPWLE